MKTLINIFGAGRSGTTMLDLMLGNDDKAFSLGEIHAWFRPYREHHSKIICSCGVNPCPFWQKIQDIHEKEFHEKIFDILEVDYLIDSSKSINWGIDNNIWLSKSHINIINLLIYKKPINYIYSIWKRGESIDSAIYRYSVYYKRFLESNLSFAAISYEELVTDTDQVLKLLCTLTNQNYFSDKKDFWTKQHHHAFGSLGTRKQLEEGQSVIRHSEEFKQEYIDLIPEIEKKISSSKDMLYIEHQLQKYDIRFGYKHNSKRIRKTWWYYAQKVKSFYRKKFPSPWQYKQ